jgi:tetratricopeptide (TPR) repeat protein
VRIYKVNLGSLVAVLIVIVMYFAFPIIAQGQTAEEWLKKGKDANTLNESVEYYSKAIEISPNYAEAYFARGRCYYHYEEYKKAVKDISKAIELKPNDAMNYKFRGASYEELKEYEKALKDYEKWLALEPNDSIAYDSLGSAYTGLGEYEKAIESYNKSMKISPDSSTRYWRGMTYYKMGKIKEASDDFYKCCSDGDEDGCINYDFIKKNYP